jgi:hypothetical protein
MDSALPATLSGALIRCQNMTSGNHGRGCYCCKVRWIALIWPPCTLTKFLSRPSCSDPRNGKNVKDGNLDDSVYRVSALNMHNLSPRGGVGRETDFPPGWALTLCISGRSLQALQFPNFCASLTQSAPLVFYRAWREIETGYLALREL